MCSFFSMALQRAHELTAAEQHASSSCETPFDYFTFLVRTLTLSARWERDLYSQLCSLISFFFSPSFFPPARACGDFKNSLFTVLRNFCVFQDESSDGFLIFRNKRELNFKSLHGKTLSMQLYCTANKKKSKIFSLLKMANQWTPSVDEWKSSEYRRASISNLEK